MDILAWEELLAPIPGEAPCGEDLRFTVEWDALEAARGSDREAWQFGGKRDADWASVKELASAALRLRSKDLRIAAFLTDACIHLHGFQGASECLRFVRELVSRFWERGLHPLPDDGNLESRASALAWFNEKFADALASLPFTARTDSGTNYGLADLRHARMVGWERETFDASGFPLEAKKKAFDTSIAAGLISLDMYAAAVKATRRRPLEAVHESFTAAEREFALLAKVLDEKLGDLSPAMGAAREAIEEISGETKAILEKKRAEEPAAGPAEQVPAAAGKPGPGWASRLPELSGGTETAGAWSEAEALVRAGSLEEGIAMMTRLAAKETAGRNRFHRKLMLADVCFSVGRERLARTILEELNEQITKHHLDEWESPELAGSVWSRLYGIYRKTEPDAERTTDLYRRLSRLDPWQVFGISEE